MKQLIYLLLMLFAGIANSQVIVFDGNVFKNKLLQSSTSSSIAKDSDGNNLKIDADNNGEITQQEVALVYKLDIINSNITNLVGLQYFVNVRILNCSQNDFLTIDVSTLLFLTDLDVSNNNNLLSIYAKNGINEDIHFGGNNSNLFYICADEFQVSGLTDSGSGVPNYIVNSYCSLSPGGTYNKIQGKILFDADGSGIDALDIPQPNIKLVCTYGSNKLQAVTNDLGEYVLYTKETGSFSFVPVFEHPEWYTATPVTATMFTDANNNTYNHNFYFSPVGIHFDTEVMVLPVVLPIAGSGVNPIYEVMFRNKGNQTQNGQVTFTYNGSLLNYVITTIPENSTLLTPSPGLITISYSNLKPFETRIFKVTLSPINNLNTSQTLTFIGNSVPNGEELSTQSDNTFVFKQNVVTAATPTWMDCMDADILPTTEIGEYLHYAINFVNTGTQVAKNVTAKTIFDPTKFDESSLQILNASFPLDLSVTNGSVLFQMRNANVGGPGGSGGILFKIRSNDTLSAGAVVGVNAALFFEYDPITNPLVATTGTANTTFQNLSTSVFVNDASIQAYPNPTNSIINIESSTIIRAVELYDIFGRLLQSNSNVAITTLDISQRASGTYFIKVTSNQGQKVVQIIKE